MKLTPAWRNFLIIFNVILALLIAAPFIWFYTKDLHVTNLGPKLEYIGKEDNSLGYLLVFYLADSGPSVTYYFATDMQVAEIAAYFPKAKLLYEPSHQQYPQVDKVSESTELIFTLVQKERGRDSNLVIHYYDHTSAILKQYNLRHTNKAHIISIPASDYELTKSAL